MERASTPSNRLTRSAAKQINTPSKKIDQEEAFDHLVEESIKHKVRKSRRKTESKPETNGDGSCMDSKKLIRNSEDVSDSNSMDGFESEGSNKSAKQKTPDVSNKLSSPTISKKSLRTRRSMTPGPELESSASKKMKRSTSEGKLESGNSTPTTRRNARAKSESKDFVFTPSKSKSVDKEKISSLSESNSKYIHRNSALRIIDVIDEATEGEENSESEVEIQKSSQSSPKSTMVENDSSEILTLSSPKTTMVENDSPEILTLSQESSKHLNVKDSSSIINDESETIVLKSDNKDNDDSYIQSATEVDLELVTESETNKTESKNIRVKKNDCKEKEICQISSPSVTDNVIENSSDEKSSDQIEILPVPIVANSPSNCESLATDYKNITVEEVQVTSEENHCLVEKLDKVTSQNILTEEETDKTAIDENNISVNSVSDYKIQKQLLVDSDEPDTNSLVEGNDKLGDDCIKINIISDDSNSQDISHKLHASGDRRGDVLDDNADIPDGKADISDNCGASTLLQPEIVTVIERSSTDGFVENIEVTNKSTPNVQPENIAVTENNNVRPLGVQIENNTSVTPNKEVTVSEEVIDVDIPETNSSLSPKSESLDSKIDNKKLDSDAIIENKNETNIVLECKSDNPEAINRVEVDISNTENKGSVDMYCDAVLEIDNDECDKENGKNDEGCHKTPSDMINSEPVVENFKSNVLENASILVVETEENKSSYSETNTGGNEPFNSNFEVTRTDDEAEYKDPEAVKMNSSLDTENIIQGEDIPEDNPEEVVEVIIEEEEMSAASIHQKNIKELVDYEEALLENIISENKENNQINKVNEKGRTSIQDQVLESQKQNEPHLEENFDEDNYDEETLNKNDEGSGSDSDIYKGMSDFGTDGDERKEGSHFEDSASSELRSGDSEEYVSSVDGEEGEDEEESGGQENVPSSLIDQKHSQTHDSASGEKLLDTTSPITYEKALAILNKDRVKKIDDEEFFDMFTQELNRVSEESGSDSDIAIVDEYIMEPEEPPQKSNKPSNPQSNAKQPERPPVPPPQSNQPLTSPEHFSRAYDQPIPVIHNHPQQMSRMNYSQGGMYHQYNNQGMPPVNTPRGAVMYDQFQPSPATSMSDPRMFNNHVPQDVHFSRPGMFAHPLGPSDPQLHYRGPSGLKVRSVSAMNNQQSSSDLPNNVESDQVVSTAGLKHSMVNNGNTNEDLRISTATMTDNDTFLQTTLNSPSRVGSKVNSPILELLGLNKEKLKLLKQVLGIGKQARRTPPRKKKSEHLKQSYKIKPAKQHMSEKQKLNKIIDHCRALEFQEPKKILREALINNILDYSKFIDSSSEHSSEETPSSSDFDCIPGPFKRGRFDESSSESSVETGNREVNLDDGSMSVTVNTRPRAKPRHRDLKRRPGSHTSKTDTLDDLYMRKKRKRAENKISHSSNNSSPQSLSFRKKRKRTENKLEEDISSESLEEKSDTKRKMTQGKKQNKKLPKVGVVQSRCGVFTVDPLTATSQSSDSEAPSQQDRVSETHHMEELKRNMRINIASGKNKLSNMFSTSSFHCAKKGLKRSLDGSEESGKEVRKRRERKLKKLPTAVLEKIALEGDVSRHQQIDSASEVVASVKKGRTKPRKRSLKIKSAAAKEEYIPCVTQGATQFGISRLDKDGPLAAAVQAAKFRADRLHGGAVKRITNKELMNIKKKQKWSDQKKIIVKDSQ